MLNILFPNYLITSYEIKEKHFNLKAQTNTKEAACPSCNQQSKRVQGYYQRHPRDLPLVDFKISFKLRVKRLCCMNESCKQKTFAESFEPCLARYAQRTKRLSERQSNIAVALSAKASEVLLGKLQMPISHDTALNALYCYELPV